MSDFETGRRCGEMETRQRLGPEVAAMQERIKHMTALVDALDKYISVLGDELNDVIVLADAHGWKSTRVAQGRKMRREIAALRKASGVVRAKSKVRTA